MDGQLEQLLQSLERPELSTSVIPALLDCVSSIAHMLRRSQEVELAGTANAFGDEQLNVDVSAEGLIREALARCPSVVTASSEEDPIERSTGNHARVESREADTSECYTVAFDPLDGSSIIAPNWTVGTIIGVWDGTSSLNQSPAKNQIAAILGVYGPRTTALIALRIPGADGLCIEIAIGERGQCQLLRSRVRLAGSSSLANGPRYFAPANLRAAAENPSYMRLITQYVDSKYTLRYSGGLVPDVVHALVKGHGIYISPVTVTSNAKLRRLYELCPVALVVECAGGKAVDPACGHDILSQIITGCDDRAGLVCGTTAEVEFVIRELIDPRAAEK